MKNNFIIFIVGLCSTILSAQIPAGYYDSANGLTGAALKTQLSAIISVGHRDNGYNGLWTGYKTTDIDNFYEKDGSVLDIYSENPNGSDPYNFTVGLGQCGTYKIEGDCYNREHIVPQSLFNQAAPMVSDIHFIRPTDGKVNGMRSNFPFGMVDRATFTSKNGSKLGNSISTGYSGTVFEPIDAFKGDVARMIFYFVTRYESKLSGFTSGNMLGGSAYPGLQKWELDVLLAWAAQDPVSQTEIDRNNASYVFQGNRNPYIDHPEYVNMVWGTQVADTTPPTPATNLVASNPTASTVDLSWTAATDNIGIATYDIYVDGILKTSVSGTVTSTTVNGLSPNTAYNFYIITKDAAGNTSPASNTVQAITLDGVATPPIETSCGTETFSTLPKDNSSNIYGNDIWTSNNITWTATDSRTDQILNGSAITIRKGSLTSSTISGGIGSLTVTTKQMFTTGASGTFDLLINGVNKGSIPYNSAGGAAITTTIPNINISGNIIISLVNRSTSARVAIDDLSWSCYPDPNNMSTNETSANKTFKIYPNPVTNQELNIIGLENTDYSAAQIYSISGQLVQTVKDVKNNTKISLKQLPKGLYLLKIGTQTAKFIIK